MAPSVRPKTLHFITGNANKLKEVEAILGGSHDGKKPIVDLTNKKVDLEEVQGSIEEIATAKARKAAAEVRFVLVFHFLSFLLSFFERSL